MFKTQSFDAIILANGSYPTHSLPLALLHSGKYLCCCDLAGMTAVSNGLRPDAIVGDGDSLPHDFMVENADIFHHVTEQDYNDLTKATRFCIDKGFKKIAYLAATGKREDHTIGNIALMPFYYKEFGIQPVMITDYGWFVVAEGDNKFETIQGQQVSIFNVNCSSLKSKGLVWNSYAYQQLWQGTLNEASGSEIELDGNGIYMVYFTFEAKNK